MVYKIINYRNNNRLVIYKFKNDKVIITKEKLKKNKWKLNNWLIICKEGLEEALKLLIENKEE